MSIAHACLGQTFFALIAVIVLMGLDRKLQRDGLVNRNFVLRPGYTTVLWWLVIGGFALGLWHLANVSVPV